MPYPNFHACRLKDPDSFQKDTYVRMTRKSKEYDKEYDVIMAKITGDTKLSEQAYRYKQNIWTASEAKSHCSKHGGSFEAAEKTKEGNMEHETKIKELEAKVATLETDIAARDGEIKALTEENKKLSEDNKRLDKESTVAKSTLDAFKAETKDKDDAVEAEKIMDAVLSDSALSENLHPKVKSQVNWKDYKKDGEFNKDAFKEAFAAETKDWDTRLSGIAGNLGHTETKTIGSGDVGSAFGDENELLLSAHTN